MTRVLILAEVGVHRETLGRALADDGRIDVVGAVAGLEEALAELGALDPDIVLVDMPTAEGTDAVRALVAPSRDVKVIALAVPEVESNVIAFAEAGAAGYVGCESSTDDLVAVVQSVSRGETLCSPEIAATLLRRVGTLARERQPDPIEGRLTARELDVLRLIGEGKSNKEIASTLSIELPTVKNHVHRILGKLNVHRRTEAAAHARRLGVLGEGDLES